LRRHGRAPRRHRDPSSGSCSLSSITAVRLPRGT
jgi:hypothetical protein